MAFFHFPPSPSILPYYSSEHRAAMSDLARVIFPANLVLRLIRLHLFLSINSLFLGKKWTLIIACHCVFRDTSSSLHCPNLKNIQASSKHHLTHRSTIASY